MLLKGLIRALILPPAGPLLLAVLGALLLERSPRFAKLCLIAGLGSLWMLSMPFFSDQLLKLAERCPPIDWRRAGDAQAVVILGGGGQRDRAPEYGGAPAVDPVLLERVSYGAYVSRRTGLPVLVTGAPTEAVAMRATLERNFGVQPRWVDARARDTFDNAENTARLLHAEGIHRIVLVTSSTHMARSVNEFTAAGFAVVPGPAGMYDRRDHDLAGYLPDPQALLRSHFAIYELLGEPVREFLAVTHLRRHGGS
ncbi:MAG TPA: YdcF family protein [Steroidobacteraceae bacterium]|jgi:uncharacterized SAM-binding protein YcdF (DUF218 family)|nr:YdcF family protein [Steroidobacteraceae bacterium]